ncbi:MAG: hypothetical protein IJ316_04435 [Clostridia bacterium]|nr:hypothetical protein [Clostridia bacterium]
MYYEWENNDYTTLGDYETGADRYGWSLGRYETGWDQDGPTFGESETLCTYDISDM